MCRVDGITVHLEKSILSGGEKRRGNQGRTTVLTNRRGSRVCAGCVSRWSSGKKESREQGKKRNATTDLHAAKRLEKKSRQKSRYYSDGIAVLEDLISLKGGGRRKREIEHTGMTRSDIEVEDYYWGRKIPINTRLKGRSPRKGTLSSRMAGLEGEKNPRRKKSDNLVLLAGRLRIHPPTSGPSTRSKGEESK